MSADADTVCPTPKAANIYAFLQSLPGRRPVKHFPHLNN
jgi:hypothetical protein